MSGYDKLKQMKADLRAQGIKVNITDLIIMDQKNDPFYIGSPTQVRQAEWFANLWNHWKTQTGHIRRIHYRIVSQRKPMIMPDGKPYENTEECSGRLGVWSKYARILELVNVEEFIDKRNDPTVLNLNPSMPADEPRTYLDDDTGFMHLPFFSIHIPALSLPDIVVSGYDYCHEDQPYYLLLIVEKTTMDDVLEPICRRYGVNYLAGAGFTSITRVRDELARWQKFGRPVRVFYISDYDPGGDAMPRSVSRQTEFWMKDFETAGIKVNHLGLTRQQCKEYDLPRTPIKETDRRKDKWEERSGEGATELDALEALYPGELSRIVTEAISPYRDMDLHKKLSDAEDESIEAVGEAWKEIADEVQEELNKIKEEADEILEPYRAMMKEANQKIQPLRDRLKSVSRQTEEKSTQLDDYLTPRPEPETTPPDESGWLFDSDREYMEQLEYYKAHKGGC